MAKHKISNLKWFNEVKAHGNQKEVVVDMLITLYGGEYYEAGAPDAIAANQRLIRNDAVVAYMSVYGTKHGAKNGLTMTARQCDATALEQFNLAHKARAPFWALAEKAARADWGNILNTAFEKNPSIKSTDGRGGKRDNVKPRSKAGASHGTDKPAAHSAPKVETAKELGERSVPTFKEREAFFPWAVSSFQRPIDGLHANLNLLCDTEAHKAEVLEIEREARALLARIKKLVKA
jgi:hypothetical protein